MDRRHFFKSAGVAATVHSVTQLLGCDKVITEAKETLGTNYQVGDFVDPSVYFMQNKGQRVTLGDQVSAYTKLVYLIVFGGAYASKPPNSYGGLWCADSVADMSVQRTVYFNYASQGVTFVPVAVPPVYSNRYGYSRDVFLAGSKDAGMYQEAMSTFIEQTESLRVDGSIPFDPIFYDPRFRLLDNPSAHEHVPACGDIESWQGRFKWHQDEQTYGTPTTWVLSPQLEVLAKPFHGNVYEAVPVSINYTVRDVVAVLDRLLVQA